MTVSLYNSMTRRIDPLEPVAPPRVTIYACGPTIWNYAHVGNFRTFLFNDLLRRYLRYVGLDPFLVMNLTDVDDRIIRQADEAGVSIRAYTDPYADAFFADRDFLRIEPADRYPRATEYIEPMVALVRRLLERGLAYQGDDGSVYYNLRAFEGYGRLSRLDTRELRTGARVASDDYDKEDAQDFALWKAASEQDERVGAAWDAPFGRGRPGWHLECSAMALTEIRQVVGAETVDLHTGGVDLIFPHHENEVAQSEGATGVPFVGCWLHGEFLTIRGTKMSKRFGNVLTVRDLREEGVSAAAFRTLVFSTHYRQKLSFSDEALEAATEGSRRLGAFRERLVARAGEPAEAAPTPEAVQRLDAGFREAMDDDLNAPEGLAALFGFVREANRALDEGAWGPAEASAALAGFDRVMGVLDVLPEVRAADPGLAAWVEARIAARARARQERDFGAADAIRDELTGAGIELEDTPEGTRWRVTDQR